MPEIMKLKPAVEGVKVRKPDGKHLKADGESVEVTSYWLRRLEAGEVVEVKAAKATAEGKK